MPFFCVMHDFSFQRPIQNLVERLLLSISAKMTNNPLTIFTEKLRHGS